MPGAGELRERLRFEKRAVPTSIDAYGNVEGAWTEQFTCWARVKPSIGGETIIAQRLAGVQPVIISIHSCRDARLVEPHWRAVDTRNETRIYNIRSGANFDEVNAMLEFMAETGVPT